MSCTTEEWSWHCHSPGGTEASSVSWLQNKPVAGQCLSWEKTLVWSNSSLLIHTRRLSRKWSQGPFAMMQGSEEAFGLVWTKTFLYRDSQQWNRLPSGTVQLHPCKSSRSNWTRLWATSTDLIAALALQALD